MSYSKFLKDLREQEHITQVELARILKVSPTSIKNIENARTKYPKYESFFRLRDFLNTSDFDLANHILFNNIKEDYGDIELSTHQKRYLSFVWAAQRPIEINVPYKTVDGTTEKFIAYFWKAGFPYYKVILANYDRSKFYNSISKNTLYSTLMEELRFFDNIENNNQLKEIRFLLDKNVKEDVAVFNAIKNIRLVNYGKTADVSFILFDSKNNKYDKSDKIYITNRLSHIEI